MESTMSVALYARVSSQRQADELTIGSQVSGHAATYSARRLKGGGGPLLPR